METTETIDVAEEIGHESFTSRGEILKAERKGGNTLILYKMPHAVKRFDGKMGRLCLVHRWHRNEHVDVHSVQGDDSTIWQEKELGDWEHKSLFGLVNLFG